MNDYQEKSRRAFDGQAADYDTGHFGDHARKLYGVLLSQVMQIPHAAVLDLVCGTGELLARFLEQAPKARCAGLDLSEGMLSVARKKLGDRAELVRGNAERLPFGDGVFDVVLCSDSFHHYPDPRAVLAEVSRVLSPGGVLLLGDCTAPGAVRGLMNLLLPRSREGDVRLYGRKELRGLLDAAGFHGGECRKIDATSLLAWGIR